MLITSIISEILRIFLENNLIIMDILNTTILKHAELISKADSIEQRHIYHTEHNIKDIYLEANTIDINLDTKIYRIFPLK